jgi:hypothetical protein
MAVGTHGTIGDGRDGGGEHGGGKAAATADVVRR